MYIIKRFAIIFILVSVIISAVGCASKTKDIKTLEDSKSNASSNSDKKNDTKINTAEKWKVTVKTDLSFEFVKCAFLNDNYGIATGFSGENRITTDGGKNWTLSMNKSNNSNGYDLIGENIIWYGDDFGDIGISTDKGISWQLAKNAFLARISYISAIDEKAALIGNRDKVAFTEDGAKNLVDIKYKEGDGSIAALNLYSKNEAYILDYDGNLYYSKDKLKNWKSCIVKDPNGIIKIRSDAASASSTACIRNFKDGNITIAFCDDNSGIYIIKSKDEGLTWTKEKVTDESALNIYLSPDGNSITYNTGLNTVKRVVYNEKGSGQ
ncbi:MAG TPA: hypothetical protein VF941_14135 [Clostridia bacterium]